MQNYYYLTSSHFLLTSDFSASLVVGEFKTCIMKTNMPYQLFLVSKLSGTINAISLNDFRPLNLQDDHGRKKVQVILKNAGIRFRQTTHYTFPADSEMYIGFPCRKSAIEYSQAQMAGLQRRLEESSEATTRFIKQYKKDMSYGTPARYSHTA